ncbi:DUF4249 family protein [Pseudobacter ginsenosidimutans]|uniref:Uncharacterized protein DUF4249 n=1 Tax=Pseudobacter ginsenosidimutans TaxID=661488 RepID=A0A4Q7N1D7_9BACT|nr:DUF4249 family protein [Pseudobacter ginsenosidimutans]QEC43985.1 DUF4249 domain-containing protein [Pseudobacter ginsenosidimutans]RZS75420.1 uncharacterized protein DUF4249 [Pseudobacter ginsenosidimutans]
MKNIPAYLLISFCFLLSCTKVVKVDLETAAPELVIDASIDWIKGTAGNEQKIKLSTTTGYYSTTFPTVSGADIVITNSANTVFSFMENPGTGEYTCSNFHPVIGQTYTLRVVLNGETYTATETCTGVPDIENNIAQNNTGGFGGDEVEITYYYQDNGNAENHYLHRILSPVSIFPDYKVQDDGNSQGNLMQEYFSDKDLKAGDKINIRLYGITKRYYDYFRKLLAASGADTGPFQTTPGSVRGNIINQTHPANFAYGYFRLSEVDVRGYTIQ